MDRRASASLTWICAASTLLGVLSAGCSTPIIDKFESAGGAGPNPLGLIRGSVVYSGPPPACDGDHVIGNVVLLLFDYNNPSPPDGIATTARNLNSIPGDLLFASLRSTICSCADTEEGCPSNVTVSAPFDWPGIDQGKEYQVRGFFDMDGDFSPFFGVRNLPTMGDISGGAVEDARAVQPRFARIAVGHRDADGSLSIDPNGTVVSGVTVTLGLPNIFERPYYRIGWDPERAAPPTPEELADMGFDCPNPSPHDSDPDAIRPCLNAEAILPPPSLTDPVAREDWLYNPLPLVFSILQHDADDPADPVTAVLNRVGLSYEQDRARFLLSYEDVDKDLTYAELPDDGHAILGSAGVLSFFPKIVLARRATAAQVARGEPRILIIGSVRPTLFLDPIDGIPPPPAMGSAHTFACPAGATGCRVTVNAVTQMPVIIPPVAVQLLNPTSLACVVPILGPLTDAERFVPRDPMTNPAGATRFAVCRELPVGDYGFNVVNQTGQAWSVPNDFGTPLPGAADVLNPPSHTDRVEPIDSQSTVLTIYDPDPEDEPSSGCPDTSQIPAFNDFNGDGVEDVPGLIEFCCAGVRHLCANAVPPPDPPVDPPIPDFCCN